ncbi:hypothetical protein B0H14DRAFT_3525849 [Mycena olivaceomarginata]|nr:hypothetical protein B0H14DRAFT_3525849 [Mycena olivaceomarginata]
MRPTTTQKQNGREINLAEENFHETHKGTRKETQNVPPKPAHSRRRLRRRRRLGTLDTSTGEIFNLAGSAASEGGDDSEGENDAARNTSPTPGTTGLGRSSRPPSAAGKARSTLSVDDDEEMHPHRPRITPRMRSLPPQCSSSSSRRRPQLCSHTHQRPQNPAPQQQAPLPQVQMPAAPQPQLGAHQPLFGAPQVPFGAPPVVFGAAQQLQHAPIQQPPAPQQQPAAGGQPPAPQQQPPAVFALPSVAQLAAMQPIPPVNADGAAPTTKHNAGQFHRHVVTNKQLLRYIPRTQLTEYNESPHNRLAILLANAGNHEEQENLMHLLRIIPLNASYYTFTPMSENRGAPGVRREQDNGMDEHEAAGGGDGSATGRSPEDGRRVGGDWVFSRSEANRGGNQPLGEGPPRQADEERPNATLGAARTPGGARTSADVQNARGAENRLPTPAGGNAEGVNAEGVVARDAEHEGLQGQNNNDINANNQNMGTHRNAGERPIPTTDCNRANSTPTGSEKRPSSSTTAGPTPT